MAGDAERLAIDLEARVNDLEKGMKKAQNIANKAYSGMKRDSKTATDRMEGDMVKSTSAMNRALSATSTKVGALGKAMLAGFAGGIVAGGIAGVVTRLGQMASEIASVGDEAKRAGLSFKAFQELKYVAEQNRVSVGALTDGMKELNLRADEFIVTGGGSAAEAFQRLGYSAEELNSKLQDPSALFTEIIGKLGDLDRAAQIRIADELFGGTGGEQFVQLISQGEEGIRRTIAEANSLGIVISDEVIAKAAEVDRKFHQIATTVGTAVQSAIVDMTHAMVDFIRAQDDAIRRNRLLAMDADAMSRYQENMRLMEEYLDAAGRVAPEIEAKVRAVADAFEAGAISADEASASLQDLARTNPDAFPITTGLSGVIQVLELLIGKSREAKAELASLTTDPIGPGATWEGVQALTFGNEPTRPRTVPGSGAGGSGGGRSAAANDAEREAKAIQNLIAGLEFERSLIGLSAVEQEKLNALRQAGASATDAQRAQIEMLVDATHREREAAQLATDQMQALSDIGVSAAESLADAFADGKLEASELLSIVGDIVKQLLTMPTGGGGGGNWLGNIFSSLLGGFGGGGGLKLGYNLASGGHVRGPGTGTSDSIPAMLSNGEFVVNAKSAARFAPLLAAINSGRVGAFASGGLVMPGGAGSVDCTIGATVTP